MSLSIKKGDNVLVIAGKDKGKTGEVLTVIPADNSVVVAGVNIVSKHKKARSAQEKSAIVKKEAKIDMSNVQLVCPVCGKATRIAAAMEGDTKYRQCKKCGANLDTAPKKKVAKATAKKETAKAEAKAEKPAAKKSTAAKKTTKKAEK
ncbi:MAG: 50S ribosomal protein L24 [Clostridia bacterium]|nr:50S ribosomal protein L24 [Clostridia bacterium]